MEIVKNHDQPHPERTAHIKEEFGKYAGRYTQFWSQDGLTEKSAC